MEKPGMVLHAWNYNAGEVKTGRPLRQTGFASSTTPEPCEESPFTNNVESIPKEHQRLTPGPTYTHMQVDVHLLIHEHACTLTNTQKQMNQ